MPLVAHWLDRNRHVSTDDPAKFPHSDVHPVWYDASGDPGPVATFLEHTLKLHPLVIEDILGEQQTPKVEDHGTFVYVVMHAVQRPDRSVESVGTSEIDLVIGTDWLFTHHPAPLVAVQSVVTEIDRTPRTLARGPAFLAHAIIDRLTDDYLPLMDRLDEATADLETRVVARPVPALLGQLFRLKRTVQRLRRSAIYQREILQRLSRGEFEPIRGEVLIFYRDVYDHFVRISDLADGYRETLGTTLEMYLSVTANRTNDIMKFLAIISTVMLPLTFIAGVYGMNFDHMPELHWRYGYAYALILMGVVALAFVAWFRHRGWIGEEKDLPK